MCFNELFVYTFNTENNLADKSNEQSAITYRLPTANKFSISNYIESGRIVLIFFVPVILLK